MYCLCVLESSQICNARTRNTHLGENEGILGWFTAEKVVDKTLSGSRDSTVPFGSAGRGYTRDRPDNV